MKSYDPPRGNGDQELVYKAVGDRKIELSFRAPLNRKYDRAPLYLIISGGGWHGESRQSMLDMSARSVELLRRDGWAVASIDYRVTGEATMRQLISDCVDAGRYLAHFSQELSINPRRVVTSGHSAGGHLALLLANAPHAAFTEDSPFDLTADDFLVVACAPMSPPTLLYDATGGNGWPFSDAYEQVFPRESADEAHRHFLSPYDYITPASVPTLLFCGTHDDLVWPENSTRYAERCRAVGAPCRIVCSYYGGHCFEPKVEGKTADPDLGGVQELLTDFVRPFAE